MNENIKKGIGSFFREENGLFSCRRLIAALCIIFSGVSSIVPFVYGVVNAWYVFLPCAIYVIGAICFGYFTTSADIKEIVSVACNKNKE